MLAASEPVNWAKKYAERNPIIDNENPIREVINKPTDMKNPQIRLS